MNSKPGFLSLEAIVFDFDGTLAVLNIDFTKMRQVILDQLATYAISTGHLENLYVLEMINAGRQLIAHHHPGLEIRFFEEAQQRIQEIEIQAAMNGRLLDGTLEMLFDLRKRGIRLGVITRNCQAAIEQIFPNIYTTVDIVLTRDHISRVKPDPEHLRQALSKLHSAPDKTAMVGDHPMDIRLGQEAGATTIGVLTGFSRRHHLMASGADMILEKAPDIMAYLQ